MCGRFSKTKDLSELEKAVEFVCQFAYFAPRYNIAPRQQVPVIAKEKGRCVAKLMRWGLIPSWAKDESIGDKLINARAETLTEKASFRKPFDVRRCLIPADGFYEWQRNQTPKIPFRFTMKGDGMFCFAGLWERWVKPVARDEFVFDDLCDEPAQGRTVETFTIITTEANEMMKPVHDRMPVILHPEHYRWWIDEERKGKDLQVLLRPYPAEDMDCCKVSTIVNNAKNDSPECVKPG